MVAFHDLFLFAHYPFQNLTNFPVSRSYTTTSYSMTIYYVDFISQCTERSSFIDHTSKYGSLLPATLWHDFTASSVNIYTYLIHFSFKSSFNSFTRMKSFIPLACSINMSSHPWLLFFMMTLDLDDCLPLVMLSERFSWSYFTKRSYHDFIRMLHGFL